MQDTFQLIARAQAEYARCIDDGDLTQWPEFFVGECVYKVTTAENHKRGLEAGLIYAASRGMLVDRIASLRDANIYERHAYRHLLGQPYIVSESGAEVRSETSFMVARIMRDGTTSLFVTGRYLDVYVRHEDSVKLRERIAVCDSSRINTLLALPL
ncbi:aromatic-ring-hydroxylating dioxygenase subunit beta [Caballeronia ptereochthonis]|uniref:Aromatic-ring-hydroxylating dioxygenase subunit beta n=1 Tax=Caballeronia ptereochthonis TaxID=1777144 RepID=A0A158E452_9BURK|nr:aromatic-ring-hydroxylating dioxygenase subunit beta [Caballeronia ptereochthonis]SAL01216.1 aromatic-ring-hydroxylating dioxygenase subunit beta [Caballeronia ptereochthonis]